MDQIPFVKVSIEEAKAALQGDILKKQAAPQPKKDWAPRRMSLERSSPDLTDRTFKWLASIPPKARPYELAKQFPRIANRLADSWALPFQCEQYLDELMMDSRGDRKGFPPEVATEIAALKMHFMKTSPSVHFGVWGNRIGID